MRKRKIIKAVCERCGKIYISKSNNQKYCSNACKTISVNKLKKSNKIICAGCDTEFVPTYTNQKFCCPECRNENWKRKQIEKTKETVKKICICCGKEFMAKHHKALYCSPKCKYKIYNDSSYIGTGKEIAADGQICWHCKNACGGCSWSKILAPVKGWKAKEVKNVGYLVTKSYKVIECPEFEEGR